MINREELCGHIRSALSVKYQVGDISFNGPRIEIEIISEDLRYTDVERILSSMSDEHGWYLCLESVGTSFSVSSNEKVQKFINLTHVRQSQAMGGCVIIDRTNFVTTPSKKSIARAPKKGSCFITEYIIGIRNHSDEENLRRLHDEEANIEVTLSRELFDFIIDNEVPWSISDEVMFKRPEDVLKWNMSQ